MNLSLPIPTTIDLRIPPIKVVPLYQVETPSKLAGRTAISVDLFRVLYPHYAFVGRVEPHSLRPSIIRHDGAEPERRIHSSVKKDLDGAADRVFSGPDGQEYRWTYHNNGLELVTSDKSKTLLAKFHSGHRGILRNPQDAHLEVTPAGLPMADIIVLTFVYIKKFGDDGQRAEKLQVTAAAPSRTMTA
ncbi:hypothetical protein BDN72DRAFT_859315 [Pluteus cervinus]|uniref:Uncharacterized protein n=1 Tax=Pluteus cervinus TaxID=181527 RepID=A0ACD3ANU6_9AGAR|nr:hypothetical protein BDN72DRAFT_859315 [Pluteus cervinus]